MTLRAKHVVLNWQTFYSLVSLSLCLTFRVLVIALRLFYSKIPNQRSLYVAVCPHEWVEGLSSCYKFVTNLTLTWQGAQDECEEMGGGLASLETSNELYWIKGYRSSSPILR